MNKSVICIHYLGYFLNPGIFTAQVRPEKVAPDIDKKRDICTFRS